MRACVLLCLITLVLVHVTRANAQDGRFDGWYQIEVIVFERRTADGEELWPKDITLRYPLNWQVLKDPEALPEQQPIASSEPLTPAVSTAPAVDLQRMPFYTLPSDNRVLNGERRRLDARPELSVLFHEAWRQPLSAAEVTPSVLIFGGERYDAHQRLEGSLHIYVSRYLHVQTNLWLSNFQTNAGQMHTPWPEIPLNPMEKLRQLEQLNLATTPPLSFSAAPSQQWQALEWETSLPEFLAAAYVPTRIVTLQQSRRMRSNETHYLDHPHLGLIVRISPIDRSSE
ncbi:MAG TPA: CsiV family protein [Cellvibrionaceae bacterium]